MRIFLIDPHPLMREAISDVFYRLNSAVTMVQLDKLSDVLPALQTQGEPELFCMELVLEDSTGVRGIEQLRRQFPAVPIVVLTALPAQEYADLSMNAGAHLYIHKSKSTTVIASELQLLLVKHFGSDATSSTQKLSKRQKQLLILLDKGMSNRDIAETLQISEHTVKVHLWRLFKRLDVKSRSQASHLARVQSLL